MFQNLRNILFWIYDEFRNPSIKDNIEEISNILNSKTKYKTDNYRKNILSHAIKTTQFYSKLKNDSSIDEFPVINKNIIRDNFNKFISNKFDRNQLKSVITSGSTGTPFKIFQDKGKLLRNTSDTIYYARLAGYKIGQRLYYLKIWNEINRKGPFTRFMQNIIPIDVTNQSDTFFKDFVQELQEDKNDKSFLGYVSAFERLCKYLEKTDIKNVSSNVKSVVTMSEMLDKRTKRMIEKYFDCEVIARYSNVENGILAQQLRGKGENYYLNTASYYFELIDINSNSPVSLGKPGRIVVTDLFNYGMPIIRYDTGDIGVLDEDDTGKKVLSKIEGRKMDMVYNTDGKLVSSFVITNNMWKYSEIKQYQFIQESNKSYCFKLNLEKEFNREKELIDEFKKYFGLDAEIRVEYVTGIPLLSSGKRKKVVNRMNQK